MKSTLFASCLLALGLAIASPTVVFAHPAHGDEFQAEGGVNKVPVNAQTDSVLGIAVKPIEPAADGSPAVLIPMAAVVDDNGRQIVFVQYENFYEPVPITTGASRGELIEVTNGLAVGEKLVTQGSLSLYAESRKTQTVVTSPNATALTSPSTSQQEEFPMGLVAAIGGGAVLVVGGAIAVFGGGSKRGGY